MGGSGGGGGASGAVEWPTYLENAQANFFMELTAQQLLAQLSQMICGIQLTQHTAIVRMPAQLLLIQQHSWPT